jgi:hypothetical protein
LSEYRDFPVGTVCPKLQEKYVHTHTSITLQLCDNGTVVYKSLVCVFQNKDSCNLWAQTSRSESPVT